MRLDHPRIPRRSTFAKLGSATAVAVLTTAAALVIAVPAALAQPSNDDFDNATAIAALPFSDAVDTSTATAASDDPRPPCTNGVGASVWYSFAPAADTPVVFDTFGSGPFFSSIAVYTGTRGALTLVECSTLGSNALGLEAHGGTTYHVMLANDIFYGTGLMQFHARLGPTLTGFSINPNATVSHASGVATLSGTVECSPSSTATIAGTLRERLNRYVVASGSFSVDVRCSPGGSAWSANVVAANGVPFSAGHAGVDATATDCDPVAPLCPTKSTSATVFLQNSH